MTEDTTEITTEESATGLHCDLCGCSFPAVRCDKCNSQIFCLSCDDMYHKHPKRRFHLRKAVDHVIMDNLRAQSRSADLPGDPSKIPIPPPRKKKKNKLFGGLRWGRSATEIPSLMKKDIWPENYESAKRFLGRRPLPPSPSDPLVFVAQDKASPTQIGYENVSVSPLPASSSYPQLNGFEAQDARPESSDRDHPKVQNGQIFDGQGKASPIKGQLTKEMLDMESHDAFQHERTLSPSNASHLSRSATDLPSLTSSPHPAPYPHPYYHSVTPPHHPYSHSMVHLNCSQCLSGSWGNVAAPVMPHYGQWNTMGSPRQVSPGGHLQRSHPEMSDPVAPAGVFYGHESYAFRGHPFYMHGHHMPVPSNFSAPFPLPHQMVPSNQIKQEDTSEQEIPVTSKEETEQSSQPEVSSVEPLSVTNDQNGNEVPVEAEREQEVVEEEIEDDQPFVPPEKPTTEWECKHCTYINPPGSHICEICCKTSYDQPRKIKKAVNGVHHDEPLQLMDLIPPDLRVETNGTSEAKTEEETLDISYTNGHDEIKEKKIELIEQHEIIFQKVK